MSPISSDAKDPPLSRLLHRLGHTTAAHPWRAISAWLVLATRRRFARREERAFRYA